MRKLLLLFSGTLLALICCSYETLEDALNMNIRKHEPKFTIAIHTYVKYPRGLDMEKNLHICRNTLINTLQIINF